MKAFLYSAMLQWKLDLRNKGVIITYYVVPLIFFAFIGSIFVSTNPEAKNSLIQSMSIFAITMGSLLGTPISLIELYNKDIKKAYKVGNIPLWLGAVNNFISAFIHLFIVSIIIFFAAPIMFDAKVPTNLVVYFISLTSFLLVSLSLGTILGIYIKTTTKLTMISQLLFLPSLMLSGIMFPVNMLPDILIKVGNIFPATWGLKVMTDNTFKVELFIPLLIIFVICTSLSCYNLYKIDID